MARILILGGDSRLARAMEAPRWLDLCRVGRAECDVTDLRSVERAIDRYSPEAVINCVGVLTVEAERDHRRAWDVNVTGAANVANAANCRLIHISSDYVFSGDNGSPYAEGDAPDPVNYYGLTKAAGEAAVLAVNPEALVLRAPFRYDGPWPYRKAFADQWMSGRWIGEVAKDILGVVFDRSLSGILHMGGPRRSVFEMAREISPAVEPCDRADWSDFKIPRDTSLDSSRWNQHRAKALNWEVYA